MKYYIVVQNGRGDNLAIFEQNEFDKVIKFVENGAMLPSAYRLHLVEKVVK